MPAILDAVRAGATTGEVCRTFGEVFGGWRETAVL
jgi:methylmalonyl-CoA mutase N-terminal domain/subunit